ncbi:nucleoside diphosphate kinase 6 [Lasius niger]|uniref:Nucleoside diphosphate kinase 6 n=1 Tax=Lasius niger TaxID=67767 RepID=A0A0J7MQR0_LASNI|nr:nucleoside diphosphate kinase 6 [Lasius niger]
MTLIPGRHNLCVDDKGNPQKDATGNIYVYDIIDKKLCVVRPDCKDLQKFLNKSLAPSIASINVLEKPPLQEHDDSMESEKSVEVPVKSKSQETAVKWKDENAIKTLIKLWQDHESLFKSSVMKNAEVWRMISESLRKMNLNWIFNAVQCENKFKDLRRHYMATKDHNIQSGVQPKMCKFYNEMEEVLSMKPIVKPVAIASSLKRNSSVLQSGPSTSQLENTFTETCESSDSNEGVKMQKKENMKKTKMERQLEAWLLANQAEAQNREEAREKRHKESMEKKETAIKVYESFMSKLLDKL